MGRDLPDRLVGYPVAERGHAVRPALHDGRVDVLDLTAVEPLVVHQRRPDIAPAMGMAAVAVEPRVKLLALRQVEGVLLDRPVLPSWRRRRLPWLKRAERHRRNRRLLLR